MRTTWKKSLSFSLFFVFNCFSILYLVFYNISSRALSVVKVFLPDCSILKASYSLAVAPIHLVRRYVKIKLNGILSILLIYGKTFQILNNCLYNIGIKLSFNFFNEIKVQKVPIDFYHTIFEWKKSAKVIAAFTRSHSLCNCPITVPE